MTKFKKWFFCQRKEKLENEAKEIYQLKEFEGDIWLTFNGSLVCPKKLLSAEPVCVLHEIRKLYVKRNTITDEPENPESV